MKRVALLLCLVATAADAQQAPPPTYTIQLTDQQIDSIIAGGAQCLEKVPYACAAFSIFVRNMVQEARTPKPAPPPTPPPAPDPPK